MAAPSNTVAPIMPTAMSVGKYWNQPYQRPCSCILRWTNQGTAEENTGLYPTTVNQWDEFYAALVFLLAHVVNKTKGDPTRQRFRGSFVRFWLQTAVEILRSGIFFGQIKTQVHGLNLFWAVCVENSLVVNTILGSERPRTRRSSGIDWNREEISCLSGSFTLQQLLAKPILSFIIPGVAKLSSFQCFRPTPPT